MGDHAESKSDAWDFIDQQISSMISWTESTPLPPNKAVKHRKSEPNPAKIKESLNNFPDSVPQSAPVKPGFKLAWPEVSSPTLSKQNVNSKHSRTSSPYKKSSTHSSKSSKDSLTEELEQITPINSPGHIVDNQHTRITNYGLGASNHQQKNNSKFEKSHSFAAQGEGTPHGGLLHQSSSPALISSPLTSSKPHMPEISEHLVLPHGQKNQFTPTQNTPTYSPNLNGPRRQSAPSGNSRYVFN